MFFINGCLLSMPVLLVVMGVNNSLPKGVFAVVLPDLAPLYA